MPPSPPRPRTTTRRRRIESQPEPADRGQQLLPRMRRSIDGGGGGGEGRRRPSRRHTPTTDGHPDPTTLASERRQHGHAPPPVAVVAPCMDGIEESSLRRGDQHILVVGGTRDDQHDLVDVIQGYLYDVKSPQRYWFDMAASPSAAVQSLHRAMTALAADDVTTTTTTEPPVSVGLRRSETFGKPSPSSSHRPSGSTITTTRGYHRPDLVLVFDGESAQASLGLIEAMDPSLKLIGVGRGRQRHESDGGGASTYWDDYIHWPMTGPHDLANALAVIHNGLLPQRHHRESEHHRRAVAAQQQHLQEQAESTQGDGSPTPPTNRHVRCATLVATATAPPGRH